MKKNIIYSTLIVSIIGLSGCVTANKQVLEKSTVFGFRAKTPGPSGTTLEIMFGLGRNEYFSNPTSTNPVYAGKWGSVVHANLGLFNQAADESYGTDSNAVPAPAYVNPQISTTYPLNGASNINFAIPTSNTSTNK